jgi:hypothetical protein
MGVQKSVLSYEERQKWELKFSDTACPPGTEGGLRLNSTCVWARYNGGPWKRTGFRSISAAFRYLNERGDFKD